MLQHIVTETFWGSGMYKMLKNTSEFFQRPTYLTTSGFIPCSIADVAPVGRNDLAEKPCPPRPAKILDSSKIFAIEAASKAVYGDLRVRKTGLLADL